MNKLNKIASAIAITTLGLSTTLVRAEDTMNNDEMGLYLGASYGWVKLKDAEEFDDDNNAVQFILGGKFNKYLAVEGSMIDFGDYGGSGYKTSLDGYTLAVKGTIPVTEMVGLYAKGGMLFWETDYKVLGLSGSVDGTEPFVGVGASFSVSENVDINLEYVRYAVEIDDKEIEDDIALNNIPSFKYDAKLDQTSLGITYTF